ncbi:hypothetical protein [Actinokineospora iranica]|uniref:Uncharacterized protein n=1 Tax=Actinokineospora iranica TaxID=1271860 RepID=A0A1G6SA31_9PSEU|nr:hypothetical protein [Actinokineospora iranica]SDD13790.1 hypothetical protein SAMN05216174_107314 [Actinokineospora iranica]
MLDTKIKGNPESLYQLADWFKNVLSEEVDESVNQVYRARTNTEADWTGPAGDSFRQRMTTGGKKAEEVAEDAKTGFSWAERQAASLETHKRRMDAIRADAEKAGLTVTADGILSPVAAPAELPAGATPQQEPTYAAAAKAHQNQTAAYAKATKDIEKVRNDLSSFEMTAKNAIDDLVKKWHFQALAFANDTYIAHAMSKRAAKYRMRQSSIMSQARGFSRANPTANIGTQDYRQQRQHMRTQKSFGKLAQKAGGQSLRAARVVPGLGIGIAIGVAWYDIEHGKPPTQAISSGVVSTVAGMGGGAAIGAVVGGAFGNVPGAIAGGLGGLAIGVGTGAVYDTVWTKSGMQDNGWVK